MLYIRRWEPSILTIINGTNLQFELFCGNHLLEIGSHHGYKFHRIALLYIKWEVVGLYLVECHQLIDHVLHLGSITYRHIERSLSLITELWDGNRLQRGFNQCQRRLQLMRDHRKEVGLHLIHLLHLFLLQTHILDFRLFLHSHIIESDSSNSYTTQKKQIDEYR